MRFKIMGILLFVLTGYILLSHGVQRFVILPSYARLEQEGAGKDVSRCIEALRREIEHLDAVTHDWAAWDDTYAFVLDGNPRYPQSNLLPQTFTDNRINLLYILDSTRNILWGEIRDIESGDTISLPAFSEDLQKHTPKLFSNQEIESSVSGMISTSGGPLLISSRPITTSDHSGAVIGHLIMGRFLDPGFVRMMEDQTHIRHRYRPPGDAPAGLLESLSGMTADPPVVFTAPDDHTLSAWSLIRDINGAPLLVLEADIPRTIYQHGADTLKFALISAGLSGMILLAILMILMNTIVTRPLFRLTRWAVAIRDSGDLPPPPFPERRDEIGVLSREFNRLIRQLREVHTGLAEANERLHHEIGERIQSEEKLLVNQQKLRALSSEMTLIEERERRQIAADLHDRIGQNLALTQIRLGMLSALGAPSDRRDDLREIEAAIDAIIQETRTLIFEISPPVLYEIGIGAAIEWLAETMAAQHGIRISVVLGPESRDMDDTLRVLIFRAVRELLLNIIKHARARNVAVRMAAHPDAVTIMVEDDGAGFDAARVAAENAGAGGFGLYSIKERFHMLGGSVEIDSRVSEGTRVTLTAPVKPLKISGGK
ncbi:CHASE4 domain-containing protein [Desulfococcus sp.]|uniref:sensor histidine kinase n=1 Tax=Desulfococcus sp. TaxID=2025834 RepID=UPI0035937C3B